MRPTIAKRCGVALRGQGFAEHELIAGGLLKSDDDSEPFAHFRHRLMFPIADERGRIVGFGGRALGEARAKYLNTPETEIFHKGELLYNLHRAARAARERRKWWWPKATWTSSPWRRLASHMPWPPWVPP